MKVLQNLSYFCLAIVGYVYAGYPLLIGALAKLYRRPVQQREQFPMLSLIIAAYNEAEVIAQKLDNSLQLDYPRDQLEIMVVADGSTDDTADIARRYEERGVRVLYRPERQGKSAAINRGVALAQGEIVVFSDANAFYYPDALRKLARNFADPTVGCVSGKKTVRASASSVGESEGLYWKYESFIKQRESQVHSTTGVVGEMNALRKALYRPIPRHIINDDAFLAFAVMRQGYRVIYEPEAVSWETPSASTQDDYLRRRRMNAGRYQLMFDPGLHPWNNPLVQFKLVSHKFLRLLLPFFMGGALLLNTLVVLLGTKHWLLRLAFLGQMAAYGLAGLGYVQEQQGKKSKLPYFAYYLVNSNIASLEGFNRYLRGKQSVLWEKAARSQIADSENRG